MSNETPNPIDVISQALTELSVNKEATDVIWSDLNHLEFKSKKKQPNYGKGLLFSGSGYTKQFVLQAKPDRFYSTENLDLEKDRHYSINNIPVITEDSLGTSIVKSNLREVGRLKGLTVDGGLNINQYLFYNDSVDRLGLGTDEPNAALSIAEMGVEVMLGTTEDLSGMVGTFASSDFHIVTDDTARISISANGDIQLGNVNTNPIKVNLNGKMSIGVKNSDPDVDLHVNGPVRIHNHLHKYAERPPTAGTHTVGDIIWNSNPSVGRNVGWVCLRAGTPGSWYPFGEIKERG